MGLDFELVDGQTPLDEEEKEGLLISTITTRDELDMGKSCSEFLNN
jgi:hypothetical protein